MLIMIIIRNIITPLAPAVADNHLYITGSRTAGRLRAALFGGI